MQENSVLEKSTPKQEDSLIEKSMLKKEASTNQN